MTATDHRTFIKEYTRALREGDAAVFAGAGVSRAAGYVDWKQLLREIAQDLELDVDRESDLVALAQYHVNHRSGRDRINQLLIDEFLEDVELTATHRLIATLPLNTVWTTNYDDLIEKAFEDAGKRTDVKRRKEDFATTRRRTDTTVYKMHGDRTFPSDAVLTKEDYETYNTQREVFTVTLKADLAKRTFLFLGFSFADPNVLYLLGRVKQLLEANSRKHYCILKAPTPGESPDGDYDCKRFAHWLTDLRRYNIQPVIVDKYEDIPALLSELNRRSHLRDVFISGSAADYLPLGEAGFRDLCHGLGRELIKHGFNIISGYGLGVGDSVIVGAMQSLRRNDDERLQLWPFPQHVPAGTDLATFWRQYRERMIDDAGICIVLSGNKREEGGIVPARGVLQEVEIAQNQGKVIIPVGATGHVAKQIWDDAKVSPQKYFGGTDVSAFFEAIGDSTATPDALTRSIIEMIKLFDT
ncbi:hypothetical protein Pla108_35450 [Botrimarina colliarenosi]|uniref:NAD(+) hydrolase ThsA n=1 Tax=Botrimarina colliarenosi TaxID=2528001 RepID=A0A5C6A7N2_9BACT|nr:SIR2 family protein [Botrimarina colliarenosi]TWT95397.1 hypothetical protein Pla108_35450 [Botrimarina colliarenosi]